MASAVESGTNRDDIREGHVVEGNILEGGVVEGGVVQGGVVEGNVVQGRRVVQGGIVEGSDFESGDFERSAPAKGGLANGIESVSGAGSSERASEVKVTNLEEGTIEVSDEEIEMAEPALSRSFLAASSLPPPPSISPSSPFGASRSRPPAPPSTRPRKPMPSLSGETLPPPLSAYGLPAARPSSFDPWALANKTLELSHARAWIAELEEKVAFRDARIVELEEDLAKARRQLEAYEHRSRPTTPWLPESAAARTDPPGAEPREEERPLVTETRPALVLPVTVGAGIDPALAGADFEAGGAGFVTETLDASADREDAGEDAEQDVDGLRDSGFGSDAASIITRDGSEDDLQQISGIGPRFEAALRRQGITRLSQIAAWSEADVRQVAKALKIPKSRIVKGRWIEVAREVIGTRAASE